VLTTQIANGSNGFVPDPTYGYQCDAVAVGDSKFWVIGRDTNALSVSGPGQVRFGLVDEASRLNVNVAISNQLVWLPRMTADFTEALLDWRDTNGSGATVTYYPMQQPSYLCKNDPFETVDELRLVYGADMDILIGEDANRNGMLDPGETDENQNARIDPGVLEYLTVYSREPNTNSDGSARINLTTVSTTPAPLRSLLQTNFGSTRANQILSNLGLLTSNTRPGGSTNPAPVSRPFRGPLEFYILSKMTETEFNQVATNFTTFNGPFFEGRVNVNTANLVVLTCLVGGDSGAAQQLISYRQSNPNGLASVAWVATALGQSYSTALQSLEGGDYITTRSYQFCADIAAVGPHGRGYRRVKFILDTSSGAPQILYRQDLTHLGWALGAEVRKKLNPA